ncbi:WxcM-like domain-containing protein [Bacteriovorax stolpii]|uniref:sugar 3,4-ketoisomerase n=1 Tax=Bacteriovorax stolpii TaxID=960 RepID=UPI001159D625|nr:FdtA/QdtA family cupin domain-containing protein [Bacteriovorax stolpii]QDK40073.1 WxcM-like domain-containing protein [Bacteriovorax stolpii]
MDRVKELSVTTIEDGRGELSVFESMKSVPFEIKRVYYIKGMQAGISRGFHAHRKLSQMLICIQGSCRVLTDDAFTKKEVILSSNSKGLLIKNMVWREMHDFSQDCILMVLASELYDSEDYICDYNCFLNEVSPASLTMSL